MCFKNRNPVSNTIDKGIKFLKIIQKRKEGKAK